MNILILGGTGFLGSPLTRLLSEAGHAVSAFHRGQAAAELPAAVRSIHGDRQHLADFAGDFQSLALDVVLDVIPYTESEAKSAVEVFRGKTRRLIALSSGDVYRAYDGFRRVAPVPPQGQPLTEDAPLRENLYPYRSQASAPEDLLHNYEKILVERAVLGDPRLPGTVLRLPMVYGPGDRAHRLFPYLKRMDDGRPAILLDVGQARWQWTRGYVENVVAAIGAVAVGERGPGRVYNIGEPDALTDADWVAAIGRASGWSGAIVPLPAEQLPRHLALPVDWQYHLATDTSRLRREFGFTEPVSREEALRRTVAWERAHPPEVIDPKQFDYAAEDAALERRAAWR
jgi:nucleoside-diphosphate-sugar epimerase